MKLAIVADGDPLAQSTNSGVARGISVALGSHPSIQIVAHIDSSIHGWRRLALAAVTFRPSRRWWWATLNLGVTNIVLRSRHRDRTVAQLPTEVDFILHVRNIYRPSKHPYLVFIDSTSDMANEGWKGWRPTWAARKLRRRIETAQYQRAAHVFTAGPQAAESVHASYGVARSRVTAIGGGVNFDSFPDEVQRSRNTIKNLLFVGTDFDRKGGDLLIEAFSHLRISNPDLTLTIVGPPAAPAVPGITYLGRVDSREDMASIFRSADIFCHPARHEPYGLVLQEAMAFGLPCVATRVGALSTIVSDGTTGLLVPPEDSASLASAIGSLIANPVLARTMGARGRERVLAQYTWQSVAQRLVAELHSPAEVKALAESGPGI